MEFIKTNITTLILTAALLVISAMSLFVGVLDMDVIRIVSGDTDQLQTLFVSRLPRLLAILCTGAGMSVAGLIMQQLTMNKFVSPTTGATSDQLFVAIPRLVRSAGLPLADASTVALLLGCEEIARNESFCMSGEGADELFAGYHIYRRADELGQTGGPWHYGCFGLMQNDDAQRLLMMEESYPTENLVKHLYDATESSERLSRLQVIDCALWLEGDILLGVHAASRASGLHLLFPYADRRMVDLATRIPARLRLKDGCGKYILRKTAQKRLPREVAFRSKIGFPTPVSAWMREQPQRESIESLLFSCCSSQFFDKRLVSSYWSSFLDGDDDMYHIVYAIYVFLIWYQECFSKDT